MLKLRDQIPLDQFMTRQIRLWEQNYRAMREAPKPQVRPCLTVSKAVGTYGVELAERLARRLGWNLFDRRIIEAIAQDAKVRHEMVEIFDEKTQNEIHKWVLTLLDSEALGSDKFFKHLVTVIRTIGEHGQAVVVGRGGNFILSPERTLRIRTVAPHAVRVARIMASENLPRQEAEKLVKQADSERREFIQRFYHRDPDDPLHYDLVLNTGTLTLEVAEATVVAALRSKFPEMA